MRTTVIFLLLLTIAHGIRGQLNFEGNPLTEDTVYTAEESHLSEKARSLNIGDTEDSYLLAAKSLQAERAQNQQQQQQQQQQQNGALSKSNEVAVNSSPQSSPQIYRTLPDEAVKNPAGVSDAQNEVHQYQEIKRVEISSEDRPTGYQANPEIPASAPQLSEQSASALTMFLNSKTPEESKAALEEYLDGQRAAHSSPESQGPTNQPHISEIVLPQQLELVNVGQQLKEIGQRDEGRARYSHSEYTSPQSQYFVGGQQTDRNINQLANRPGRKGLPVVRGATSPTFARRNFAVRPPPPQYLGPIYRAQPRKGFTGYQNGLQQGSHAPGAAGGVQIIYTKPPGHYGNGYPYSKTPNPYEDASAWFPDANHPPPDMNIYHSQLYAQSYDPYYYGYIAKYGKIKPHLYGKLGKKEEESFLSELFSSFKKHGMKHVMHPMFLLGLGIPMVTLMLSALVNHRSLARSSSGIDGDRVTDEEIDEWIAKLRKALECYSGSGPEAGIDKCSVFD